MRHLPTAVLTFDLMMTRLLPTIETISALAARNDSEALNMLGEATGASDEFVRRMAVESIGRHALGRSLDKQIVASLQDTSGYVARTACDVVASWQLVEAHDAVLALLKDSSAATRQSAIRALHAIWTDTDFTVLFALSSNDPDIGVRREAMFVLRHHAAIETWRALFDELHGDDLPRHRRWACELAEAFADVTPPPLLQLSSDPDGHVRKSATRAIDRIVART